MTRDLPFDDDETGERGGGDTAYRVANGVARTARAGAYVTGGALVAANGGGVPAQPGSEQHLDSWNAGWARSSDPDPDVPSPVLTFPDPGPAGTAPQPVAHPGPNAPAPLPVTEATLPVPGLRFGTPPGTDSMVTGVPTGPGWEGTTTPALDFGHPTGAGQIPLTPGWDSAAAGPTPGWSGHEFELPGTGMPLFQAPEMPSWWEGIGGGPDDDDQADGFGLPAHGLGQAGHGFGTGDITFTAPGADPLGLTRMSDADPVRTEDGQHGHHDSGTPGTGFGGGLFDGIGSDPFGLYVGIEAGAEIDTHFTVDFGLGPQGAYLYTDLRVEASAGVTVQTAAGTGIGDQLDRFGEWLGSTPGTGRTGTEGALPGASGSGLNSGLGGSGAGAPASPGFVPPPVQAATAPAPQPAPVAPAAVPIAVAPAVVAPPVVAATPLQTTIQPDAASTPIANVLAPPPGPSPLTAPAADLPLLFPAVVQPPLRPEPSTPAGTDHTAPHTDPATPGTGLPTTVTRTTVQVPSAEPSTPAPRPGTETGVTTKPAPSTLPDVTVTRTPPTGDSDPTRPSQGSTAPGADATTPGGGAGSTAPTAPTTRPEAPTRPSTPDQQPEPGRPGTGGETGSPGTGRPTAGGDTGGPGTGSAPTVDLPTDPAPTGVKPPPAADQPGTLPTVDNPSIPTPPNPATQPKPSAQGIADDGHAHSHWWQLPALTDHAPHTLAASEFGATAGFGYGDPLHPLPDDHNGALL
ncbi:hypothetical protein [Nocardia jiangsuensis]|uniref:Uncharacterized protein n=1 Tax=Nocardia jiangsuensis TaxID=1691563 RepID=A0ABV8E2Q5_9NOCA